MTDQGGSVRRLAIIGGVAAFALAAGGCGASDEEKAAEPVKTYLAALADGDGDKACAQLAGEMQREFVHDAQEADAGLVSCAEAVTLGAGVIGPDEEDALREADLSVKVQGDEATVEVKGGDRLEVANIDGDWLIVGRASTAADRAWGDCVAEAIDSGSDIEECDQ